LVGQRSESNTRVGSDETFRQFPLGLVLDQCFGEDKVIETGESSKANVEDYVKDDNFN
jgi:hypothetical protein